MSFPKVVCNSVFGRHNNGLDDGEGRKLFGLGGELFKHYLMRRATIILLRI